jgi:hypothetical protein
MELAAIWAWIIANEAAVATIFLILSEILGAVPAFKSNGIVSFLLVQLREQSKKRGGVDPTPND